MTRELNDEEREALRVLAKRGRLLVILVPVGVPAEWVQELSREVNVRLDEFVAERDSGPVQ